MTTTHRAEQRRGDPLSADTQQLCPVAAAVDVFTDVRALLILRDLSWYGPQTAPMIHERNQAIAPTVLDDLLDDLEAHEVVERVGRPGDRGPLRFRLTSEGAAVAPAITALARFGEPFLRRQPITPVALAQLVVDAAHRRHDDVVRLEISAVVGLEIAGRAVRVVMAPGILRTDATAATDVTMACTQDVFLELVTGTTTLRSALLGGEATVAGPLAPVEVLFTLLHRSPRR